MPGRWVPLLIMSCGAPPFRPAPEGMPPVACPDGCQVRPNLRHAPFDLEVASDAALWVPDQDGDGDDEVALASVAAVWLREGGDVLDAHPAELPLDGEPSYGATLHPIGDVDGDGADELGVLLPGDDKLVVVGIEGQGAALVEVLEIVFPAGELPPWTQVTTFGDVDGDGHDDLVLGRADLPVLVPGRHRIDVLSGADPHGAPMASFSFDDDSRFGASLARCDLGGDGVPELLVGAPSGEGGRGRVHVYASAAGEVVPVVVVVGATPGGGLGSAIACLGDADSDGREDFTAAESGAVVAFRGGLEPVEWTRWDLPELDGNPLAVAAGQLEGLPFVVASHRVGAGYASLLSFDPDHAPIQFQPPELLEEFSPRLRFDGDWNADGCSDLLVFDGRTQVHLGCPEDADDDSYDAGTDCDDNDRTLLDPRLWGKDLDGDGYAGSPEFRCEVPPEPWVEIAQDLVDCDDDDRDVHPRAVDTPRDGVDGDCDGEEESWSGCSHAGATPSGWVASLLAALAAGRRRQRVPGSAYPG